MTLFRTGRTILNSLIAGRTDLVFDVVAQGQPAATEHDGAPLGAPTPSDRMCRGTVLDGMAYNTATSPRTTLGHFSSRNREGRLPVCS